jgi:hypothetical protein
MSSSKTLLLLPLFLIASGCNDSGDTVIVNSDCGLIRSDLLGVYTVVFAPVTADLFNCSDPFFNGKTVTVTSRPSISRPSGLRLRLQHRIRLHRRGRPQGLFGNAETDSCGMSFSVLDNEGCT